MCVRGVLAGGCGPGEGRGYEAVFALPDWVAFGRAARRGQCDARLDDGVLAVCVRLPTHEAEPSRSARG